MKIKLLMKIMMGIMIHEYAHLSTEEIILSDFMN